jgi:hypothetical protein
MNISLIEGGQALKVQRGSVVGARLRDRVKCRVTPCRTRPLLNLQFDKGDGARAD